MLARFEANVELVVQTVRIDKDRVRLILHAVADDGDAGEPATALTIQWPTDLSRSFEERLEVERLIGQFLAVAGTR